MLMLALYVDAVCWQAVPLQVLAGCGSVRGRACVRVLGRPAQRIVYQGVDGRVVVPTVSVVVSAMALHELRV